MNTSIVVRDDSTQIVELTAQRLLDASRNAIAARGLFTLALAGGSTPRALYALLASDAYRSQFDWENIHIFFGDDRAVPPTDELSNFKMASDTLLSLAPLPQENIHRMETERDDLESAALDYETQLKKFGALDVVLLGMGDDGHAASLFPHSPALEEKEKLCVATPVASLQPHVRRLTLTYPAINAARHVWILVTGEGKATRLAQVISGQGSVEETPISGMQPKNGELVWFVDSAAASLLQLAN
jgi:6-phosphogluconolactonase